MRRDHLFAERRALELPLTRLTHQHLALIDTHDDLGRNQLDHFGPVVIDALALFAANGAGPLLFWHANHILERVEGCPVAVAAPTVVSGLRAGGAFSGAVRLAPAARSLAGAPPVPPAGARARNSSSCSLLTPSASLV